MTFGPFNDPRDSESWEQVLKKINPNSMWLKKDPYDFKDKPMNLEDILECLNDGYQFDQDQQTVVPAVLDQELILQAANLYKPKWIKSEDQLPEIVQYVGFSEYSEDVLIYDDRGCYKIAYLVFNKRNSPNSGYKWFYDRFAVSIENTYWMPLPNKPKV